MIVHLWQYTNTPRRGRTWDGTDERGHTRGGDTTLHYYRHQGITLHRGAHPDPSRRRGIAFLLEPDGSVPAHVRLYWAEL